MVYSVTPKTFAGFISSNKWAILRVTVGTDTEFPATIEDHFDTEYRGNLVYGTMRWEDMPVPAWREKHLKGYAVSVVGRNGLPGQPGYYLFINENLWHYEPEVDLSAPLVAAVFKLVLEGRGGTLQPPRRPSVENAVIGGIEKHLSMSIVALDLKVAAKMAPKPQAKPKQAPRPPPGAASPAASPKQPDHHEVLGVPRDATKETVDRVFKRKSLGCHPDGYGGLPAEVVAGAEADFKRLTNARDAIYKQRGWS